MHQPAVKSAASAPGSRRDTFELRACSAIAIGFVALSVIGLSIRAGGWQRYMTGADLFYDAEHYVRIARGGYDDPALFAFYPLWSWILGLAGGWLPDAPTTALVGGLLATAVFLGSLWPTYRAFKVATAGNAHAAAFFLALYAFNPHSVFHALAFSESLCALILALLLRASSRPAPAISRLFFLSLLAGLTRPVVAFMPLAACAAALLCTRADTKSKDAGRAPWRAAAAMAAGPVLGYVIFGLHAQFKLGNFLQPFAAQALWNRRLGFYWELILKPHSVGGSGHVLFWDLVAFYGPLALVGFALYRRWRPSLGTAWGTKEGSFAFWWSALFAAGHSVVALLTYPEFMSLGRHVFALPTIFFATAFVIAPAKLARTRARWLVILVSIIFFVRWWARFAKHSWIG